MSSMTPQDIEEILASHPGGGQGAVRAMQEKAGGEKVRNENQRRPMPRGVMEDINNSFSRTSPRLEVFSEGAARVGAILGNFFSPPTRVWSVNNQTKLGVAFGTGFLLLVVVFLWFLGVASSRELLHSWGFYWLDTSYGFWAGWLIFVGCTYFEFHYLPKWPTNFVYVIGDLIWFTIAFLDVGSTHDAAVRFLSNKPVPVFKVQLAGVGLEVTAILVAVFIGFAIEPLVRLGFKQIMTLFR